MLPMMVMLLGAFEPTYVCLCLKILTDGKTVIDTISCGSDELKIIPNSTGHDETSHLDLNLQF